MKKTKVLAVSILITTVFLGSIGWSWANIAYDGDKSNGNGIVIIQEDPNPKGW